MSPKVMRLIEGFQQLNKWQVRGLNAEIAKRTGFTASYVGKVFKGVSEPAEKFLLMVCESFGISRRWVLEGEGDILSPVVLISGDVKEGKTSVLLRYLQDEMEAKEAIQAVEIIMRMPKSEQKRAVAVLEAIATAQPDAEPAKKN